MTKLEKKAYEAEAMAEVARMFSNMITNKWHDYEYYKPAEDEEDCEWNKEQREKLSTQADFIEELATKLFK